MTITRAEIARRARTWVGIGLKYDQAGSHDGYRTDCSGYVSMCWNLDHSDDTTGFLPNGEAREISKAELRQGDALLNKAPGNDGHIVLFDSWPDEAHDSYLGYEFTPHGVLHHVITYPYFQGHGTFFPVRPTNVSEGRTLPTQPPVDRRRLDEEVV